MSQTPILQPAEQNESEKPFVVIHERLDSSPGGDHRPGAGIRLTPALRTSGLLTALPPDDLRTLLLLFTFVTANGWIRPSVEQMAQAMNTSSHKTLSRLNRLASFSWNDEPIIHETRHGSGMVTFSPTRSILDSEEPAEEEANPLPAQPGGSREAVISHIRAHYAHPRAEVERDIAIRQGWPLPDENAGKSETQDQQELLGLADELYRRLAGIGVAHDEIHRLLREYDLERIARQLRWLPYRKAKSPARLIVAAIEDDYDEPAQLRHLASASQLERVEAAEGQAEDIAPETE